MDMVLKSATDTISSMGKSFLSSEPEAVSPFFPLTVFPQDHISPQNDLLIISLDQKAHAVIKHHLSLLFSIMLTNNKSFLCDVIVALSDTQSENV